MDFSERQREPSLFVFLIERQMELPLLCARIEAAYLRMLLRFIVSGLIRLLPRRNFESHVTDKAVRDLIAGGAIEWTHRHRSKTHESICQ